MLSSVSEFQCGIDTDRYGASLIHTAGDLYTLTREQILSLDGKKEKSTDNLLTAIQNSKTRDVSRLIFAFGIRNVGQKAAKVLAQHFGNLDAVLAASAEELTDIRDIGPTTAQAILEWRAQAQSQQLIEQLRAAEVNFTAARTVTADKLAGQTVVVTGTLTLYSRKEIESLIEAQIGRASCRERVSSPV